MKSKSLAILNSIKNSITNYSVLEGVNKKDIEEFNEDILNSLPKNNYKEYKEFIDEVCEVFIECLEEDEDISLPDVLEHVYKESQIKQYFNDLIEKC